MRQAETPDDTRDENIAHVLALMERYGITLEELEADLLETEPA
jgi:hypothetical protein